MAKKKHKKNKGKKHKSISTELKTFVVVGAIFHYIVYSLKDVTMYSSTLFWSSALLCGLFFGSYFSKKMELWNPESYSRIDGIQLKAYMFFITLVMMIGGLVVFGSLLNGTILGLNYIGKDNSARLSEYNIQRIEKHTTRTRSGTRTLSRKTVPRVYFEKNEAIIGLDLAEKYDPNKDYSVYRTIELKTDKGMLGFEIVNAHELRK